MVNCFNKFLFLQMFLIVGDILKKDLDGFGNDVDRWVIKEFLELMEKKGYIHIEDLDGFRNDVDRWNNSKFSNLSSQIFVIISRGAHIKYTKEILEKFPNLKYILLAQIGNDNVDLEYCKQKGIEVKNFVSQKSIYSVAEQTVASLIWGIRQVYFNRDKLRQGVLRIRKDEGRIGKNNEIWERSLWKNLDEDIVIWIMGFGRIGQKVADLLSVFPCKMIAYDVLFENIGKDEGRIWKDKIDEKTYIFPKFFQISETLQKLINKGKLEITWDLKYFLKKADYISVHIPWFKENLGLLDYENLKKVSWVVNMARAGIVVEEDILKLLDEWKMEFYVSDVVEWEPYIEKINQKLINHPKVFVTTHIGANTIQVQEDILGLILEFLKWQNF